MRSQSRKFARVSGLEIAVCGEGELSRYTDCDITHVVSIWDMYQSANEESKSRVRNLFPIADIHFAYFDDVTQNAFAQGAPSLEETGKILALTKTLPQRARLLVHCRAGISRSSAIALAIMCQRAGPGYERECLRGLLRIRPHALPNRLILSFADQILGHPSHLASTLPLIPSIMREILPFGM